MTLVDITIPGAPTAKGRARATRTGRMFTPSKTRDAESTLAGRALVELASVRDLLPLTGPLRMDVTFTLPVAASWSKKDRAAALTGTCHPTKKPDVDNLVKLTSDALNGVVWVDDAQLVQVMATKRYGSVPSTRIIVDVVGGAV